MDKNNYVAYYKRGDAYSDIGKLKEALEDYDTSINLNEKYTKNNDAYVYSQKGNIYKMSKKYEKVLECYNIAISKDNTMPYAYCQRADYYKERGEKELAINDYSKAIEYENTNEYAYCNRGNLYEESGNKENALKDYTKAIEINNNVYAYCQRGRLLKEYGQYDEALKDFNEAIKRENNNAYAYCQIGHLNILRNEKEEAWEAYNKAIEIKPLMIILMKDKSFCKYVQENVKNNEEKKLIANLFIAVMSLKESFLYNKTDEKYCFKQVAHYTKLNSLKYLFKLNRHSSEESINNKNKDKSYLRINNAAYMNDPTECVLFINLLKASKKELVKELIDDLYEDTKSNERVNVLKGKNHVFLLSFSEAIDTSLPMWVQYSDNGKGCCLVYDISRFDKEEKNSIGYPKKESYEEENITDDEIDKEVSENNDTYCLYKVKYLDELSSDKIDDDIRDYIELIGSKLIDLINYINKNEERSTIIKNIIINILDQVRFLFKDKNYEHEKEVRIVKFESNGHVHFTKDSEDLVIPHVYINFKRDLIADEVKLGPKVTNSVEIANYLFYTKKVNKVTKSHIKYQ